MEHGRRYFMELIGCEKTYSESFKLSVDLPGGELVSPITYDYLAPLPSMAGA